MTQIRQINTFYVELDNSTFIIDFIGSRKKLEELIEEDIKDGEFRPIRFLNSTKKRGYFISLREVK
jgi:hypothetical protein